MSGKSQDPSSKVPLSSEEEKVEATDVTPSPSNSSVTASSQNGTASMANTVATSSSQFWPLRMHGSAGPDCKHQMRPVTDAECQQQVLQSGDAVFTQNVIPTQDAIVLNATH